MIVDGGPGYELESVTDGLTLVATGKWSEAAVQAMESGGVDGLDLNYAKGFKDTDLSFIRDWPVRRLSILARTVKDLSAIERLSSTLESLKVQSATSALVNLSAFPCLTHLAIEWAQVRSSIAEAIGLQDLSLLSFNEVDLTSLRWNSGLRRLRFKDRPRLESLAGVEKLHLLEYLGVYLAPLQDLEALHGLESPLSELHVEGCRIRDLEPLAGNKTLQVLNASECGDLPSLAPIRDLNNLKVIWMFGTTKVLDDDLSPLAGLPKLQELRMQSRRAYRPSVEEIQNSLTDEAVRRQ